jgi:uncharacterized C2H2 Zn-finger protein
MAQQDLFHRFKSVILAMKEEQPDAIADALEEILRKAEEGKSIVKYDLQKVTYDFEAPLVSLNILRCPSCGRLFKAGTTNMCPFCKANLYQAYVGVPLVQRSNHKFKFSTDSNIKLVIPITTIKEAYCKRHRGLKALKPIEPKRPLQSLAFKCHFNDASCQYYHDGLCTEGSYPIYFPLYRGLSQNVARPALANPSVNITKPFSITIFPSEPKQGSGGPLGDLLTHYIPVAREVVVGEFTVYILTIMYLLGHPYSGRYRRLPVFDVDSQGNLIFLGRKLKTEGLLVKLDYSAVEKIGESIKATPLTVVHSISHIILLALTRLTGLSPSEFGEAVFVDKSNRVAEILIYDNSPGGIGGVRSIANDVADFVEYICDFSRPCPRMCRSACRACVFYETCGLGNMFLSWRAAEKAVNRSACLQP